MENGIGGSPEAVVKGRLLKGIQCKVLWNKSNGQTRIRYTIKKTYAYIKQVISFKDFYFHVTKKKYVMLCLLSSS